MNYRNHRLLHIHSHLIFKWNLFESYQAAAVVHLCAQYKNQLLIPNPQVIYNTTTGTT
jgi:hypothetical protein